jgi:hypothetical protein
VSCEFCAVLAGRFNANRACCRIRLLTGAPAHTRREEYARVKKEDGDAALAELKNQVNAEYQRQQEYKAAIVRAQVERETAKGREESAALLKKIKESNMNVPPLERKGAAAQKEFA